MEPVIATPAQSAAPTAAAPSARVMPSFATGTHAHRHTMHSALVSLSALGVPQNRVSIRRAGSSGATPGTIVRQSPAPGEPLSSSTMVELDVAGLGFTHALPVGMWDSGGEAAAGTREILSPLDDPLEKLKHWFHEGAPLFRIGPNEPQACARWLALFGITATDWPRPMWFRLASLVARMAQLSCSEEGCEFVLGTLLGLPVQSFTYRASESRLPPAALSGLGARSSQLGVDLLMGDRVEDLAMLKVELGPVSLATYERFAETPEGAALLARTLDLVMPCSQPYEIAWAVLDRNRSPQLGVAEQNARLGINTHLGGGLYAKPPLAAAMDLSLGSKA